MSSPLTPVAEVDLLTILDRALAATPGVEAELSAASTKKNTSRFAGSVIHQNTNEEVATVTARVVAGGRIGAATGNDLSIEGLRELIDSAAHFAAASPPVAGFRGLPEPAPLCAGIDPDVATATIAPLEKASRLVAVFRAAAARGVEMHGSFTTQVSAQALASSRGIRASQTCTLAETVQIAVKGKVSGYASQAARTSGSIPLEALADEAVDKCLLGCAEPRELPPGPYDVVLEPAAVSEILEWLTLIGFSSRSIEDGSSFLCDKKGEKVTGENFTLWDDATDPAGLTSRFDGEGVAKRRTMLIDRGVGVTATFDKVTADRFGVEPTGHSLGARSEEGAIPTNLFVAPGNTPREELLSGLDRGIWISRFHYLNGFLDPKKTLMTGMTRDGAFWIENGRVVAPIVNMRWTESILAAFARIDGMTPDRRSIAAWWGGGAANTVPAMRIRGFQFTGVSKQQG